MKTLKSSGVGIWGFTLAWFAFIIFLSSQPGEATAKISLALARFLLRLLNLHESRLDALHAFLRTTAHFVGFFVLGALLYAAMRMTRQKMGNIHFWAAGIVSVLGVLDEIKKVFISGRHLSWAEAGLNVIGAWCGIIAAMAVMGLISASSKAGAPDGAA